MHFAEFCRQYSLNCIYKVYPSVRVRIRTLLHRACSTRLSQPVALTDGATETHIHEALSVGRDRSATGQHETYATAKDVPNLLEDQPRGDTYTCLEVTVEVNAETCLAIFTTGDLARRQVFLYLDSLIFQFLRLPFTLLTQWTSIHSFNHRTCCDFVNCDHKPWSQPGLYWF